ncbi:MAG TPA: LysR family transcriptional regulator [Burkholderiales bacterium]|nr:LysR family transcriptional regulator [Burkholderiales bacterium]
MNLAYVESFLAVANAGGFREAAKQTGLSQPAVSQHVGKLEQLLKTVLIVRKNSGCVLTAEGRLFVPHAEALLRASRRALQLFESRALVIGASSNIGIYFLPPYLQAFRRANSGMQSPDLIIGSNPEIAEKMQNLEVDVAVMEWWDHRPGFRARIWRREDLVVIVAPDHPWSALTLIEKDRLKGCNLLGGEPGTGTGRLLQSYFGEAASSIGIAMQLGSTEAVKRAVQSGLGISLALSSTVAQEHAAGRLCAIPFADSPPQKELFVIWPDSGLPDSTAFKFSEFL